MSVQGRPRFATVADHDDAVLAQRAAKVTRAYNEIK